MSKSQTVRQLIEKSMRLAFEYGKKDYNGCLKEEITELDKVIRASLTKSARALGEKS